MPAPIGTWDPELHAQWSRAKGERKRLLMGRMLVQNEPLLKILTGQLRGDDGAESGRRRRKIVNAMRVVGSEDLDWEECLNIARISFTDAMRTFDPRKGRPAIWIKFRIRYELQRAVELLRDIKLPRAAAPELRPQGYLSIDLDDDGKGEHAEAQAALEAALAAPEDDDDEPAPDEHEDEVFEHEPPESSETPPFRPPPRAARLLVDRFVLNHCVFKPRVRVPRAQLFGAFTALGWELGLWPDAKSLSRELGQRGVRRGASLILTDYGLARISTFVGVTFAA